LGEKISKNQKFESEYDIVIIGAGIGGLLTAANFIGTGKKICIIERLGFAGGRFSSIPHDGFQISTGAIHLLPHGSNGPMGRMLKNLINQPIADLNQCYFSNKNDETIVLKKAMFSYFGSLVKDRLKVAAATARYVTDGRPEQYSALKYLTESNVSEDYILHLEKFTNFSISMNLKEISAYHLGHVVRDSLKYWKPGIVLGGCGSVVQQLLMLLKDNGIDVFTGQSVREIDVCDEKIGGVVVSPTNCSDVSKNLDEYKDIRTKAVVSDIGPKGTIDLLPKDILVEKESEYIKQVNKIQEANGFKFHVCIKRSPVRDAGVVFPLFTERIGGYSVISNGDKSLAPLGKNLLITHAVFKEKNQKKELDMGIEDLENIIGPEFEFEDILSIGTFHGSWPVNRARQGEDISVKTPIDGLYLVGDGCKPRGNIMAEGVAQSVNILLKKTDIKKIIK
jgi:phytoene dehydrogenase-like protein